MSDVEVTELKFGDRVKFTGSSDPDDTVNGTLVDPREAVLEEQFPGWNTMLQVVELAAQQTGEYLFWVLPEPGSDPDHDAFLAEIGQENFPFYAFRSELSLLEV